MPAEPHLDARFTLRIGTLNLDVAFAATAPWTVLFGPSGSGKSTILRVIAGLVKPHFGYMRLNGQTVLDTKDRIDVPTYLRPLRWAGQRALLMPGKKVAWSLLQGLNRQDPHSAPLSVDIDSTIKHFGLGHLTEKRSEELSGGECQRVAVIRAAIGARGKHLLLDEPFAGLDAEVRDDLIPKLRSWLGGTPILSVTHDIGEVFRLGAEVIRVSNGKIVAQGPAEEILADARHRLLGTLKATPQL